jgi:asparagine synthase (glutamine-hydrolysing)
MCGIVGRYNFKSGRPVDAGLTKAMADLIAHRGPDDAGVHVAGSVGLGNRRLAIVDLSPAGHQPMQYPGADIWITYNGEIYNFRELRAELEGHGHRFHSSTDTEVVLASYVQWGDAFVSRLRGMFAIAIWDGRSERLVLARDRVGKKPLYYTLDQDGVAFGSEAKSFLADPRFSARPCLPGLSEYLTFQYVPGPQTAFEGVSKLQPGHYLIADRDGVRTQRYWRLRYDQKSPLDEASAEEAVLAKLREAVRIRLISDVPLGAFLSGGIDSSAVVAFMAEQSSAPVKTFSIGFDEREYNELTYARLVAQKFGTDHHEFVVRPDALSVLPQLAWCYSEPFGDSSAVPTYYLAKLTREHVTVALNGDGGDENFAGYPRYLANVLAARVDILPKWVRHGIARLSVRSGMANGARPRSFRNRVVRFAEALDESPAHRYSRWVSHFRPPLKSELCTTEFMDAAGERDYARPIVAAYEEAQALDFIDETLSVDVETYLPEDLLVKMDIATMAHSLEGRSPFLDHEFMELCASLSSSLKLRGKTTKYLLKNALRGILPDPVLDRPKMGFGVPIDRWFRGELKSYASDLLLGSQATSRGYFNPSVVERLINEHASGIRSWHHQLWNLVMLELWHRAYVDRPTRTVSSTAAESVPVRSS